jgi:hypothetical protein
MENLELYLAPVLDFFDGQPWFQGGAIMLITFLVASFLSWVIFKTIKFLTSKTKSFLDDRLLAIARPPIYYSLLITGFSAGINRMPLSDKITDYIIFGFKSLGVIIWMIALIRVAKILLQQLA